MLWEMFSLGYSPDGFMGYACGPNDLKEELVNGKRLGRESLRTIPDELLEFVFIRLLVFMEWVSHKILCYQVDTNGRLLEV